MKTASNIRLIMRPEDAPLTWTQFLERTPGYSVAIDGYVGEGPNEVTLGPDGPRQNFNHHEGVYRLVTLATCEQALRAIRMGFFETFRDAVGRRVNIYTHDCDEDVCATAFCFLNSHLIEGTINPSINRYLAVTGLMDATGGAYPMPPDLPYLQEHAWTVEPYLRFRARGGLDQRIARDFELVVEEVCHRILAHVLGRGESIPLDTDYQVLHQGTGWTLVRELGTRARLKMFNDGIRAYVSVATRADGRLRATVGRFSGYIPFDVRRILEAYNAAEGLGPTDDCAGGSDLVGRTSRRNGTALPLSDLIKITEAEVVGAGATRSR